MAPMTPPPQQQQQLQQQQQRGRRMVCALIRPPSLSCRRMPILLLFLVVIFVISPKGMTTTIVIATSTSTTTNSATIENNQNELEEECNTNTVEHDGDGDETQHQQQSPSMCAAATAAAADEEVTKSATTTTTTAQDPRPAAVPDDCQLVYAPRFQHDQHRHNFDPAEWGIFTLVDRRKGTPVFQQRYGDIVIQWPDPPNSRQRSPTKTTTTSSSSSFSSVSYESLLLSWTWNGRETGGQWEGKNNVESVVPGLAMMAATATASASATATTAHQQQAAANILPLVPRVDEGGLTRIDSPGAGAITHYHNYTWWFSRDVHAGDELLLLLSSHNYGRNRTTTTTTTTTAAAAAATTTTPPPSPSIEELKSHGYCLDNIRPRKSRVKGAGRGAFATRNFDVGSIISPVPMISVHRNELLIQHTPRPPPAATTGHADPKQQHQQQHQQKYQLLLNYCLGRNTSDWLYFPYSPVINLINHYHEPNVKLRMSSSSLLSSSHHDRKITTGEDDDVDEEEEEEEEYLSKQQQQQPQRPPRHIMLELVATRPIQSGDELYLDYGRSWEEQWWDHVERWRPYDPEEHYAPAYVLDDTVRLLRTQSEQNSYVGAAYAKNVMTTCFYRYSDRTEDERKELHKEQQHKKKEDKSSTQKVRTFRWKLTKGLYELKNLRPCRILKRIEDSKGRSVYAVQMLNHPSLPPEEIIPFDDNTNNNNALHLVTHIPRSAIRFSDKPGTTDQHLPNAFRHEIGLPDDIIDIDI
jgi:SET domain